MPDTIEKRKIEAKILRDSIIYGNRLASLELTFPRFILAEFNTHRAFSRNSASTRAIPTNKLIQSVVQDPFIPRRFPVNEPGMSATKYITDDDPLYWELRDEWLEGRDQAVKTARRLFENNVHKQIAGRVLEPYLWHKVIVSSVTWDNFFSQRDNPAAQPEMEDLAIAMKNVIHESVPTAVERGDWHTPLILADEETNLDLRTRVHVSIARCARVSYMTHAGIRDIEEDLKLFNRLETASPTHYSPMEHVAKAVRFAARTNFSGSCWKQYRAFVECDTRPPTDREIFDVRD